MRPRLFLKHPQSIGEKTSYVKQKGLQGGAKLLLEDFDILLNNYYECIAHSSAWEVSWDEVEEMVRRGFRSIALTYGAAPESLSARFRALSERRMGIVISHRFSTVRMADQIVVLVDGEIVERGTHEQLMAHNQRYARLFNLQAEGYR